jgi:poly(3-hydroxybutyrate) depolymerase
MRPPCRALLACLLLGGCTSSAPVEDDDASEDTGSGGSGGPVGTGTATVGAVTYAYHVPSCAVTGAPAPVLFTQHGQGGTGAGMVAQWTALADAECFIVIGQGSRSGNGWNFDTDVTGLGALVDAVDAQWDIDTERRVLHGYSAGAHWSYVIGLANSDTFGGLIVYAGAMSYADSTGVWPDGTQGPIPVAIGHGTDDSVVSYAFAQQAESRLAAAGWPVELWTAAGGSHAYDPGHQGPAWAFVMEAID